VKPRQGWLVLFLAAIPIGLAWYTFQPSNQDPVEQSVTQSPNAHNDNIDIGAYGAAFNKLSDGLKLYPVVSVDAFSQQYPNELTLTVTGQMTRDQKLRPRTISSATCAVSSTSGDDNINDCIVTVQDDTGKTLATAGMTGVTN
jgi:hypothetical protein